MTGVCSRGDTLYPAAGTRDKGRRQGLCSWRVPLVRASAAPRGPSVLPPAPSSPLAPKGGGPCNPVTVVTALCSLATFFDIRTCPGARAAQRQAWPGRQEATCAGRGLRSAVSAGRPFAPGVPGADTLSLLHSGVCGAGMTPGPGRGCAVQVAGTWVLVRGAHVCPG